MHWETNVWAHYSGDFTELHCSVFKKEILDIIQSNLGIVKAVRVGGQLSSDGWAYVEFKVEGEHYHVGPRVFVYEHPRYSAQSVVMKSYDEKKKTILR